MPEGGYLLYGFDGARARPLLPEVSMSKAEPSALNTRAFCRTTTITQPIS